MDNSVRNAKNPALPSLVEEIDTKGLWFPQAQSTDSSRAGDNW